MGKQARIRAARRIGQGQGGKQGEGQETSLDAIQTFKVSCLPEWKHSLARVLILHGDDFVDADTPIEEVNRDMDEILKAVHEGDMIQKWLDSGGGA